MGGTKYCTECGEALRDKNGADCTELYDQELYAKTKVLKLVGCNTNVECRGHQVADKYVECDGVLLLIDLVLQSKPAYRHVLLNGGGYAVLVAKMAMLTVLCDGYIAWSHNAAAEAAAAAAENGRRPVEFFEREYEFYLSCSKVALALFGFVATVMLTSWLRIGSKRRRGSLNNADDDLRSSGASGGRPRTRPTGGADLVLGLLLSYSSRCFNLMSLLWSPSSSSAALQVVTSPSSPADLLTSSGLLASSNVMWGFVYLLFILSSVRVHQVTQDTRSAFSSWLHLAMGHVVFICLLNIDRIFSFVEQQHPLHYYACSYA